MAGTSTLMELLQKSVPYLEQRGIANARREVEWLFADTLGLSRIELYTRYDMPVGATEMAALRERITRRGRREPLAYILGTQPFCALELAVGPDVLVPRPETEELVELVLRTHEAGPLRVLDVGTGSGAIACALKRARPAWTVHAVDASAAALVVARDNAARHDLEVCFHHAHLVPPDADRWNVIVANLPYVGEDERENCDPELAHEPQEALFAGPDGLALIRELVARAPALLQRDGALWLEIGFRQAAAVLALAEAHDLDCRCHSDAAGHDRFCELRHG